jgi:uncharacterized protein
VIALQIVLMIGVIRSRRKNFQSLSDGGHPDLLRAIRRHGNLAENAAIFIAGFTLLELMGANKAGVAIICAVFVIGRFSHAIGLTLDKPVSIFRIVGVMTTVLVGFVLAIWLIWIALSHLS